jgi:SiaC family regulatory phosphoprotein
LHIINGVLILKSEELRTDEIHILPTSTTPEIILNPKGIIKIKGRAIDESRANMSPKLKEWIDAYVLDPPESTEVTVALEFLNSFNTLLLTATLKSIAQVIQLRKHLIIRWYYEEDDVDLFERGEYISSTINVPIEFIETNDLGSC